MNLLIIGGSGLLGGRLYKHFKEKQYNVKILVRKTMEEAVSLTVPLIVETGVGNNWMETK